MKPVPWFDPARKINNVSEFSARKAFPPGMAAAPSGFCWLANLTKIIGATQRANADFRALTETELRDCYSLEPVNPANRAHAEALQAAALQAAALQAHRDAREASGKTEDPPPPKPAKFFNLADLDALAQEIAIAQNMEAKADGRGVVQKVVVVPSKIYALSTALAGTGTEPSEAQVLACLKTEKQLRTPAGDFPIPGGES